MAIPQIVIVGGGAGGLELVTQLGASLGKPNKAKILLVDQNSTHIWKPLLHEVAAGTLDANEDEVNYFVHASAHHYFFQLGKMVGLDRGNKHITLDAIVDESGKEIIPTRVIPYDVLVLAMGSVSNDLGISGVKEHGLFLDSRYQADVFQKIFLGNILKLQNQIIKQLDVVIIGGGATGVELAAELFYTLGEVKTYGLDLVDPKSAVNITLIEGADRILSTLPERISELTTKELRKRGINVLTKEYVKTVEAQQILTASGKQIHADMIVWAAGIKIASIPYLDGLAVNRLNQFVVGNTLQVLNESNIFAMGDCAACSQDNKLVPPRAQAASQEAAYLAKNLRRFIAGKPLKSFYYKDYGSLITLSKPNTFGSLMGRFTGSFLIEGRLARLVYLSLYKKHQSILHGRWRVFLLTLANRLTRKIKPHLKLH